MFHLGKLERISFSSQDRPNDGHSGVAGDITQNAVDLDVHFGQGRSGQPNLRLSEKQWLRPLPRKERSPACRRDLFQDSIRDQRSSPERLANHCHAEPSR